jgi:hypothetical protein
MNNKYLFIGIILLLAILFLYKQKENLNTSDLSNEALQNIASVYGDTSDIVTFNNVNITGKLKVDGVTQSADTSVNGKLYVKDNIETTKNIKGKLTSPNGKYQLYIDDNGKLHVLNEQNIDINIMGNFTGRFFSPNGDYFAIIHNNSESGIVQGYSYDKNTNKATLGSVTQSTSGTKVVIPSNSQILYNDIIMP